MAQGNIMPYENTGLQNGGLKYKVTANSNGSSGSQGNILPGEPVQKLAGAAGVTAMLTNSPTATNRVVGVAADQSTDTASADGTVTVIPARTGQLWLIAPKVAATWNTQAKYNALCGARVLIDLTTGVYTLLAADGAGNGCIVEFLDIARYPGQVAFSFSPLSNYANV